MARSEEARARKASGSAAAEASSTGILSMRCRTCRFRTSTGRSAARASHSRCDGGSSRSGSWMIMLQGSATLPLWCKSWSALASSRSTSVAVPPAAGSIEGAGSAEATCESSASADRQWPRQRRRYRPRAGESSSPSLGRRRRQGTAARSAMLGAAVEQRKPDQGRSIPSTTRAARGSLHRAWEAFSGSPPRPATGSSASRRDLRSTVQQKSSAVSTSALFCTSLGYSSWSPWASQRWRRMALQPPTTVPRPESKRGTSLENGSAQGPWNSTRLPGARPCAPGRAIRIRRGRDSTQHTELLSTSLPPGDSTRPGPGERYSRTRPRFTCPNSLRRAM
mmetsp:Transcript_122845/g.348199  ORF Transcript_122845/g.348199 Transcript_122845/m.348199 type:complete len:336 (+) Transcript_122845:622-1629(+)